MRFARFMHPGGLAFGVVEGEADAGPETMIVSEIDGIPLNEVRFTGQRWALADVLLLAPIVPSKVIGVGRNYPDHAAELGNAVPTEPIIFLKPSTSVIGPSNVIRLPPQSAQVEHEAELAVVIGATGAQRVDRAAAARAIFGYTCANDVTARDLQRKDGRFTRAKGFNTFCPIGPWIVTDLDPADLEVRCEVNEEVRQLGRTSEMVFDVPTLVSYISHIMTLLPGDIILTGTPAGVAPLADKDVVSVSVQGIGTLTNRVAPLEA